jgi:peptidylprolyl isomerase
MLRRRFLAALALVAAALIALPQPAPAQELDPENTLVLELKDGKALIQLLPQIAPKHVAQIKTLVRQRFYDGIVWHRVMEGFMAQTGDPTGTGRGSSSLPDLPAEFSMEPFTRGAVGMARSQDPDSGNSQWFICFEDCRFLDGQYTVFARVVQGMEAVDKIKKAPSGSQSGMVSSPDRIVSLRVLADVR